MLDDGSPQTPEEARYLASFLLEFINSYAVDGRQISNCDPEDDSKWFYLTQETADFKDALVGFLTFYLRGSESSSILFAMKQLNEIVSLQDGILPEKSIRESASGSIALNSVIPVFNVENTSSVNTVELEKTDPSEMILPDPSSTASESTFLQNTKSKKDSEPISKKGNAITTPKNLNPQNTESISSLPQEGIPPKRGPGRPRKRQGDEINVQPPPLKRGPGRPRKSIPAPIKVVSPIQPGFGLTLGHQSPPNVATDNGIQSLMMPVFSPFPFRAANPFNNDLALNVLSSRDLLPVRQEEASTGISNAQVE